MHRILSGPPQPARLREPATAAIFVLAAAATLQQVTAWASGIGPDDWAYAAWGRMIAGGHLHLVATPTYPNPLGYLLGLLVAPLAPQRAFPELAALAMALSVALLFRAGTRSGGALGGALAACVFVSTHAFAQGLQWAIIDAFVAAIVVTAVAFPGRIRVVLLVLAGLARPEAWAVAALACYLALAGRHSRPVRAAAAVAAGLAAPAIWAVVDWWLWGAPFAFLPMVHGHAPGADRQGGILSLLMAGGGHSARAAASTDPHLGYLSMTGALSAFWGALVQEAGGWQVGLGIAGLVVLAIRAGAHRRIGFLPVAAVLWSAMQIAELQAGLQPFPRYTFPLVVLLAAGTAALASPVPPLPGRRFTVAAAGVCAAAAIVLALSVPPNPPEHMAQAARIVRSLPVLHSALECGDVGVLTIRRRESPTTAMLAVLAGVPLSQVPVVHSVPPGTPLAGVLVPRGVHIPLPPGRRVRIALGSVLFLPGCAGA